MSAARCRDVQAFKDDLGHLATASQARRLSAVKSLLSFGHELGCPAYNVGAPGEDGVGERAVERHCGVSVPPAVAGLPRCLERVEQRARVSDRESVRWPSSAGAPWSAIIACSASSISAIRLSSPDKARETGRFVCCRPAS